MSFDSIGGYSITRELGQGGMGKVYQARSSRGETVALKTVLWPENMDPRTRWEVVERFQREARAARSLDHPNICQVLDIGADDDTFFIVMEFLDGQTVGDLIQFAGAVKVERAMEIIISVCEGLAYAHEQGIVHRDIKPDNIMLLRDGRAKLTDFGLASITQEASVTQTGTTLGTFFYMSPEQAKGSKLDARSDIFSLGATFYEMVTGRRPFLGDAPGEVIGQVLSSDPPPIENVPSHISRTVNKCLRKAPHHRFQNAREIIQSLRMQTAAPGSKTAVIPSGRPGPVYVDSSPTARAAPDKTRPEEKPASRKRIPDLSCSKCNEPMSKNTPSCWRCGTPNPLLQSRKHRQQHSAAMQDALRDLTPAKKKRSWFRRGR